MSCPDQFSLDWCLLLFEKMIGLLLAKNSVTEVSFKTEKTTRMKLNYLYVVVEK